MASKTIKARAFAFIVYPDSWATWRRDLQHLHMPVVISPLHDKDTTEDGIPKKPHRHAIISWENPTTLNNALTTLLPFGINYVQAVGSYQGYCRYLCHLDDPEKAQYDAADIVCLNGAVVDLERKLTNSEVDAQCDDILAFVEENGIVEYIDIVNYARLHRPDWRAELRKHSSYWQGCFKSIRGRNKTEAELRARNNLAE